MMSTFSGIEIGKRSIQAHSVALSTVGHNMSNAARDGYSRQRVELEAFDPIYRAQLNRPERPGQIGQGVEVARIERIRDQLLDRRIVSSASAEGYWNTRDRFTLMLDRVYNEPTDNSLRTQMDRFWDSWQELHVFPEQMAARQAVLERGTALADGVRLRHRDLSEIQNMVEGEIQGNVVRINEITRDIADLNRRIVNSQAAGDNPNDLMDRRDLLVDELSVIIDISVDQSDPDEFNIHTAGRHIVQGRIAREFVARENPRNEGFVDIEWGDTGEPAEFAGGTLGALVELRDVDLRNEIQNLDMMAINFVDMVNEIHRDGTGMNGRSGQDFFVQYPFVNNTLGNYDASGDGEFDSTYLFRIGGVNRLDPQEQIGLAGTMTLAGPEGNVEVGYNPTDTVEDVVSRINNSSAEVTAHLNRDGRLVLKGTPAADSDITDFVIRYVEDDGQFLTGYAGILSNSGPEGAFSSEGADNVTQLAAGGDYAVAPLMHPSAWLQVNEQIATEPASIAAGFADGEADAEVDPGDGSAALAIAQLRYEPVMIGRVSTFDDYFADSVANVGLKSREAEEAALTQSEIMKDLRDMRQSISGVNMDEELAEMIKFQHGYNAAARFISTIDGMLDTIINRMGA